MKTKALGSDMVHLLAADGRITAAAAGIAAAAVLIRRLAGGSVNGYDALNTFRSVFLIAGSCGLLLLALLIMAGKTAKGKVKDKRFEAKYLVLSFPTVLSEISVVLLAAGAVFDGIVRAL